MGFQQAAISIEREREFEELKSAIERAFSGERVESLLKRLQRDGVRIRDWDAVLNKGVLEKVAGDAGEPSRSQYEKLKISDQAQIRELYLFRVEEVDPKLRSKFHRIYQYY